MAVSPTLIVGVGDAGAKAVAESKNRFRRLLKGNTPGIAFLAILPDDSVTVRNSDALAERISEKLSRIVAAELTCAGSNLRKSPKPEELLGKQWLGSFDIPEPALLNEILSEIAKKNDESPSQTPAPPKTEDATGSDASSGSRGKGGNLRPRFVSDAINDTVSKVSDASMGLVPQQLLDLLSQMERLLMDVTIARARVGFTASNTPSASGAKEAEDSLTDVAYSVFMDAAKDLLSQVQAMASKASGAASSVMRAVSRGLDGAGIDLSQDDVGRALGHDTASDQTEKDANSIAEAILSQFSGPLGISSNPTEFDKVISEACVNWISKSNPDGVLWLMLGESGDFRLEKLEPGEYIILSPSKYEPEPTSGSSEIYTKTPTRSAIHQAFFDEKASSHLSIDVDRTINSFSSPATKVDMKESLRKLGLSVVETPVSIFVIADVADPMGGELIQDITGLVLQTCERNGLPADITGILIVPRAISGIRSAAMPQARAYATLKEICHWWSEGIYRHIDLDEHLQISVNRPLFNSIYIVESPEFDAEKSAGIASCSIADFLSVMMLCEKGSFSSGNQRASTAYTRYPISSFGTGRLHYPDTSVAMYSAFEIAHAFALNATESDPNDANGQPGLSLWSPAMQPSDIIRRYAGKTDKADIQSFRDDVSEWFESVKLRIFRELDEAPVGKRLTHAMSITRAAFDAIKETLPRITWIEWETAVRRKSAIESEIRAEQQSSGKASRGNIGLVIASVLLFAGGLSPIIIPALVGSIPGLATAAAAVSGHAAPLIMAGGIGGSVVVGGYTGKRAHTVRTRKRRIKAKEEELHKIVNMLQTNLDPMDFKYIYLVITQWRLESLHERITSLYDTMSENVAWWKSAACKITDSLPLDKLTADSAGNVTLITKDSLQRELERVKSRILTDHCTVKLSKYLGWSNSTVNMDLPCQILDIIDGLSLSRRTCISVLEDMANSDEPVSPFLDAVYTASKPRLNVNEAKIGSRPSPVMILSLDDLDRVAQPPLAQALPAVGINPTAGYLELCGTWDDMSIMLCQTWDKPVEIVSLLPLPEYFRSYLSTECTEMLTSDPASLIGMEEISDPLDESKAKSIMVQALALDLLRPPYDPAPLNTLENGGGDTGGREAKFRVDLSMNRALLDALNSDPHRVDALARLISERCGKAEDTLCIISWLEWVVDNRRWWGDVLGLVEPDLGYITRLMEDLKSGRKPGGSEL